MGKEENYVEINRQSWNNLLESHIQSDFYDLPAFLAGASSLHDIELKLLGKLKGKEILHLQCHFGQDSLSLARLGAKVTGVDLSDRAIQKAESLAEEMRLDAHFICSDIYDLPQHLEHSFDIVFSSYGVIAWLPDLTKWAQVIARFLKPGGKFVFVEFHPVLWMFDEDFSKIQYSYFNESPIIESESGTYANPNADLHQDYISWNHSLGEVINSLVAENLRIESLEEFDYSPYDCFAQTVEVAPKKFRIKHLDKKLPMVFALQATRID